ncbi:MAG: DUF2807 domain-containing protein [Flavobacterium sp.]|nr:DUF2807 domain-containing protein [Flavobacterium sp.]
MKKYTLYFLLLILIEGCGISEDCFKGNGNSVTQVFPLEGFTKVKVYDGVGLSIKEGPNYEVKIVTNDKILDQIHVAVQGDMLVVKDNSTCNIARDYGQTTVYVTAPNLVEIHSKTNQDIRSDGVLNYGLLRLFSIEDAEGTGTGDFFIHLQTNGQLVVESNSLTNFHVQGNCGELLLNFYFGNGRFNGENFISQNISIFHRGSNDMIVHPMEKIDGTLLSTGNVQLRNIPTIIDVEELFTGRLIY